VGQKKRKNQSDAIIYRIRAPKLFPLPFHSSIASIISQADAWLENMDSHLQKSQREEMKYLNSACYAPFEVMAECDTTCVGGACRLGSSKIVCAIEKLQSEEKCVVYIVSGNNMWEFEVATVPMRATNDFYVQYVIRFDPPRKRISASRHRPATAAANT
jgi:hypothetical protein